MLVRCRWVVEGEMPGGRAAFGFLRGGDGLAEEQPVGQTRDGATRDVDFRGRDEGGEEEGKKLILLLGVGGS